MPCWSKPSLSGKKPRITYLGVQAIAKYLDVAHGINRDWRMLASKLNQKIFTMDYIEYIESLCPPTSKSPTKKVLVEWQQSFRFDECIPVARIIDILIGMGHITVASEVERMLEDGTFLDFEDSDESPTSTSGGHAEGPASARRLSGTPSQPQPMGSAEQHPQAEAGFHYYHPPSPQQVSFFGWPSDDSLEARQGSGPQPQQVPRAFNTFQTQPPITNYSSAGPQVPRSPHNLKKSNYSLHAGSYSPHQPRQEDRRKTSLTWPRGHKANQKDEDICRPIPVMGSDTSFIHPHPSGNVDPEIHPLRSFSPDHIARASPVQVSKYFITYGYPSYKLAMEMGMALKALGHDVMVDTKNKGPSSAEEAKRLFQTSTFVVVIYNLHYQTEVMGYKESPLNTKLIFDLMVDEFRAKRGSNVRFVPIVNSDEVREDQIPTILRRFPLEQRAYVCNALRAFRPPVQNEVAIQRTVYSSRR